MTSERSSTFPGATREAAEAAYYADASVMARMGYTPASEEWSAVDGEHVLSVRYRYDPEQAPVVLRAIAEAESEALAVAKEEAEEEAEGRPSSPPSQPLPAAQGLRRGRTELIVGLLPAIVAGGGAWWLVVRPLFGDPLLALSIVAFALAGLFIEERVALPATR